jgi:MoxR-like ATPase
MTERVYSGRGARRAEAPRFTRVSQAAITAPENYRATPELATAVEVAITLAQPLLLTGLPGTGKTQLAHSIAWELGYGDRALTFETKSTSVSRDLFYYYDTLGRFQASYLEDASKDPLEYIEYNALGKAILLAHPAEDVKHLLPKRFVHPGPAQQSVVLIDEIDKAPRDFPNDLLNEIEGMFFRIPELRNAMIAAPSEMRPIVIITSNSEKNLPDAFLRRCIYHHIPKPSADDLRQIVSLRVAPIATEEKAGFDSALDLFIRLRDDNSGVSKKPSTAELIAWIAVLRKRNTDFKVRLKKEDVEQTLCTLVKLQDDNDPARRILDQWVK